ncbi:hypothetical protein B0H14DRAFT_2770348 [Mycena olivaceomarginata]|nr:hypothetical protein B0H14DRAFT_2770348 [Mycena olivaceomarginata]
MLLAFLILLSFLDLVLGSFYRHSPRHPTESTAASSFAVGGRSCRSNNTFSATSAASSQPLTVTQTTATVNTAEVASGSLEITKPTGWPTATLPAAAPTSTVTSTSDPYLKELSKASNNSGVSDFTSEHKGDMTYYFGDDISVACGDVYDDNSYTAAVSYLIYDAWPGANTNETNRNPICGPFVPGRTLLDSASGDVVSVIKSPIAGHAEIGGDGRINCIGITHGGKSIQVRIVDRCAGCKRDDIDLRPGAFTALADMSIGRTDVAWKFDNW